MGNPCRIMFVGGCHINGYPVGEESAFTHVVLGSLPQFREGSACVLPLANLRSGPQILSACRELKPDAVVLQLGHYESPVPLRKSLGWKALRKAFAESVPGQWRPRPQAKYGLTLGMMFAEFQRVLATALIILVGKRQKMFNAKAIAASIDSILAELKELPLRAIVVLGPFAAPDPVTRYFRRKAAKIFEAAAKKHGCVFVDVFSILVSYPRGEAFRSNFADPLHLSVLGHKRVGAAVGEALRLALDNATAEEGVAAALMKQESRTAKPKWARQSLVAPRSPSVDAA